MRHQEHGRRRAITWIVTALALVTAVLAPVAVSTGPAAATGTPVLGPSRLTGPQIAAWFRASTHSPYQASVPVDQLAALYVSEGAAASVRGDVAFAQSVVETGWFSFPANGYVRPTDNNFAGIGAYGDGSHLFRAPDALTGVRGQVQLLRRYADAGSSDTTIGNPPIPQLWNPSSRYNTPGGTHGWAPTWEDMSTRWASSPTYATTVLGVYAKMLAFNGIVGVPDLSTTPMGRLDAATRGVGNISVGGWAVDPTTTGPIPVHVYVDGVGAAITTANQPRPDVAAAIPGAGADHGFVAAFGAATGQHTVCAYAISASGGPNPSIGCQRVTTDPIGSLDQADARSGGIQVGGWAIGPNTAGPVTVHVYVDGVGRAILSADTSRPDVGSVFPGYGPSHGFAVTLPLDPSLHTVCAYAIAPDPGGSNTTLGCRMITGSPFGAFDAATRTAPGTVEVAGWTISGITTGPVTVHVYVNGVGTAILTAQQPRTDVGTAFPGFGDAHGFDAAIPAPAPGSSICVYGINTANGPNSVLGCRTA